MTFKDYTILNPSDLKKELGELHLSLDEFCNKVNDEIQNASDIISLTNRVEREWENDDVDFKLFKKYNGNWWTEGYVGVVNLNINGTDITINIRSRFDSDDNGNNFLQYVFDKAFNLGDRSEARGRIYNDMSVAAHLGETLDLLLMCLFFKQLNDAMKKGLYRQYRDFAHNDSKVKGRIDIARHIKENPISNGKNCYVTREYSLDNPINRLILKASDCIEKKYRSKYQSILNMYDVCKKGLAKLRNELSNSESESVYKIINNANKKIAHSVYRDYEALRQNAISILKRLGHNSFRKGNQKGSGVLLYMPDLWEAFLKNTVMREIADPCEEYFQKSYNGTNKRPDFWFENKRLIFDAKFKPRWRTAYCKGAWDDETKKDYDQVTNYIIDCNCNIGGIVFPIDYKMNDIYDITEIPIYKHSDRQFLLIPIPVPTKTDHDQFCELMDNNLGEITKQLKECIQQNAKKH